MVQRTVRQNLVSRDVRIGFFLFRFSFGSASEKKLGFGLE